MLSDTLLTCNDIYAHLQDLPGMTAEKARLLLDPADKQNVPKAVNLLQSLLKLEDDAPQSSLPSTMHRRHILSFFARIVGAFTLPFISISMSLSEQVRSLATYAHLIAVLWIQHGTRFMTGALYADSQAIVKNIFITIARLQLVDENLPFYIIHEGTDRLEGLFADCRTQDHNRNFDVLQLSGKLATSSLIQGIMERNPDLDRGHRRLSLKDAMGVDHVNPRTWSGNVRVGDVELAVEWNRGREEANKLLEAYLGSAAQVDFDVLFPAGGGRDLLRPLGDYVGSLYDPDDSRTEDPEIGSALDRNQDGGDATGSSASATDSPSESPATADDGDEPANHWVCDDEPEGVDFDDFLPSGIGGGARAMDTSMIFSEEHFLMVDGRKYLKASVVTIFLTAKRSRKVTIRTLRSRGITIEDLRGDSKARFNSSDTDGKDLIKSGDLAAVLVRIDTVICLAVVEVLEFEFVSKGNQHLTAVELEDLEKRGAEIEVLVQALKMHRIQDHSDVPDTSGENARWVWDHHYAQLYSDNTSAKAKRSQHTFRIPGSLVLPLGPSIEPSLSSPTISSAEPSQHRAPDMTWSLSESQLDEALDTAWEALSPDTEQILTNVELLPAAKRSDALPYKLGDGE